MSVSKREFQKFTMQGASHHSGLRSALLTLEKDRIARMTLVALDFRMWELYIPICQHMLNAQTSHYTVQETR